MKALVLFNNKGGVGKTSIVYHLGYMFAELGHRVLLADLDPQANLTTMCVAEARLEQIFGLAPRPTFYGAIERLRRGVGDVEVVSPEPVTGQIGLIAGDLQLSEFEDELSEQWPKCLDRSERAFLVTTALSRVVEEAGRRFGADLALLDVGPNFGAINRAALIAADHVVVPVAPDLFSMRGLENVGPRLGTWREQWSDRRARAPELDFVLPPGSMEPIGYVVGRHTLFAGGPVRAFQRWIDRMPAAYRRSLGAPDPGEGLDVASDPLCLGQLKDYRSLMAIAQEARKPMFLLKPADGAIGGHQAAVREAYADFKRLAGTILERIQPAP
jgi:cellulose biosynthesis protein BcsQ